MFAALFVSLLLLGTPVRSAQDSVSAQQVENLESRIAELEKQVLEYRARENYFRSILASQRWTFGTVVGLFAALVGLVGFGVFKRYVSRVEETQEEMEERVDDLITELESQLSGLSEQQSLILDRIRVLERRQESNAGDGILRGVSKGAYPSTFIEKARSVRDELPSDDEGHIEAIVEPSVELMEIGLRQIGDEYQQMPKLLKEEGTPLLKQIERRLEGWNEEQKMVREMIRTIEEG